MPPPTPARDVVLKYLRHDFPYQRDLVTADNRLYTYGAIRDALYALKDHATSEVARRELGPAILRELKKGTSHKAIAGVLNVTPAQLAWWLIIKDLTIEHWRILSCYMNTKLARTWVADVVDFDSSTVKRKLDALVDALMACAVPGGAPPVREPEDPDRRDLVLAYLRNDFALGEPFTAWDGKTVPHDVMKTAVMSLKDNDAEHLRILHYFMNKSLTRTNIAKAVDFDQSTVKRKLDAAADTIMNRVLHSGFWETLSKSLPNGLFQNRNPFSGEVLAAAYPITNWRTD